MLAVHGGTPSFGVTEVITEIAAHSRWMKPRRRRIKVYATGAHRGALEQPRKCKNKRRKPISQLPGSAGSQQRAEDQAQIERPDVRSEERRVGKEGRSQWATREE